MSYLRNFILISLVLSFANCSSMIFTPTHVLDPGPDYQIVYAGTRMNYYILLNDHHPHGPFSGGGGTLKAMVILDFPMSFLLDTGLLPFTLIYGFVSDQFLVEKEELPESNEDL